MSNVYIDERLLDAACLTDFPELYAYIKERYPKPIGELPQPVPIGDQTLQQQVKNNDDIIIRSGDGSNEDFVPLVQNVVVEPYLSSQLERQNFLASSGLDPQLIVYGYGTTLTASYATTGLFSCGKQLNRYLFKSYHLEVRPKSGNQVISLVGTDAPNTYSIFCYFDQNGLLIICSRKLPSITALLLNITYYKQVCVFNLYFESKGLQRRTQEVDRVPDSVLYADGKKSQESISKDSADVYKCCASGMYYL
ncbi:MAG: hypothetical protein EZS28_011423 [Streblomastix strix]|uniref:Uncharacterized protein n=1 Tax=Streblomastix strix TaxID=222440 RepID=A0A5J4WDN7_9EUKA|nr:MAG: hypothetical protein EZS28_011423 [Streblomastix strix]